MTYQTPPSKSSGENITVANWNTHLKGNLDALANRPVCAAGGPINSQGAVTWGTPGIDSHGMWSAGLPTRLTTPTGWAGIWRWTATNSDLGDSTTQWLQLAVNGVGVSRSYEMEPSWPSVMTVAGLVALSPGDYVQLLADAVVGGSTADITLEWLRAPA